MVSVFSKSRCRVLFFCSRGDQREVYNDIIGDLEQKSMYRIDSFSQQKLLSYGDLKVLARVIPISASLYPPNNL